MMIYPRYYCDITLFCLCFVCFSAHLHNPKIQIPKSYNPLRGCFEQDRFTFFKCKMQCFFYQDFAGNTVIPQHNYKKSCRTPSHSLATHFYTCLPVVFTTNEFVQHLSNSLTFNVSGISSLILKCLFPQDAACLMYFACHFLLKTTLSPWFPIIKLPPKSCKRLP